MFGVLDDATSGVPASLGAGNPDFVEISAALEVMGLRVDDEDEIYHLCPIPWDMDPKFPLRFRVWFVSTSTDADTPEFNVSYSFKGKQAALTDVHSTSLDDEVVSIPAHTCSTTDDSLEITAWAETLSQNYIAATDFLIQLCLEVTSLGGASANELVILGLEMDYTVGAAPNTIRETSFKAVASPTGPNG